MPTRSRRCLIALACVAQYPEGQGDAAGPDRHVDPEDPAPGDVSDYRAADDDAEDGADAPAHRIEAVRPAAPFWREQVRDDGSAVGGHEGPPDALDHPEADDRGLVPGKGAEGGAEDEHDKAGLVHAHSPEHVAEAPDLGREQGDDQQVADNDPERLSSSATCSPRSISGSARTTIVVSTAVISTPIMTTARARPAWVVATPPALWCAVQRCEPVCVPASPACSGDISPAYLAKPSCSWLPGSAYEAVPTRQCLPGGAYQAGLSGQGRLRARWPVPLPGPAQGRRQRAHLGLTSSARASRTGP